MSLRANKSRAFQQRAVGASSPAVPRRNGLSVRSFRSLIPPGTRVLELGCGTGDLLAALFPSRGVGVDRNASAIERAKRRYGSLEFCVVDPAEFETDERFDYIVLTDLIEQLADIQAFLTRLHSLAHSRTRVVVSFDRSSWWRRIIRAQREPGSFRAGKITAADVAHLFHLAGWEVVRTDYGTLCPIRIPVLAKIADSCLSLLSGLRWSYSNVLQVARPIMHAAPDQHYSCSVIVPARNEAGTIPSVVARVPEMGTGTEIIFVEGGSQDGTWGEIQRLTRAFPGRRIKACQQRSPGKAAALHEAIGHASGDLLFILDADLTVRPEELPKFYEVLRSGRAEFVNGVRLLYPMPAQAMPFLNSLANRFFAVAFSWLLGRHMRDTLCGTKALFRADYLRMARHHAFARSCDPFGDFDLLFGAGRLSLRMADLPVRYQARVYGRTAVHRWRHGWLLGRSLLGAIGHFKSGWGFLL